MRSAGHSDLRDGTTLACAKVQSHRAESAAFYGHFASETSIAGLVLLEEALERH
jgi:hypothetical protein